MKAERIFARAAADLRSRMGVGIADLTADEVVQLVRACERVADPFREVNAGAVGMPVRVSAGVWFWPLTIGAVAWLEETADRWWADDPRRYRNALVYAALHAREPEAFAEIEKREVERLVRRALRTVTATSAEVDAALDRVLGIASGASSPADDEAVNATATSWAHLLAKVEASTGIVRDHWLWDVSYAETLRAYHEARQVATASGERAPEMLDELDDAVNALQRLKVNIMNRVKAKAPEQPATNNHQPATEND